MTKYYQCIGSFGGVQEVLYGSFLKEDCIDELDAEGESWKSDGYKEIKISSHNTDDTPDSEVYK